ncbi:MAG TPA: MCE family protein [Pseudonocardiaceae bacterium]|jgi:phospholipid/cholesterol/gamma-HCH transport system substrate-binding protein
MNGEAAWLKIRRRAVGVVFLVVLALLVWLSIAIYDKQFTPVVNVMLDTGSAGNEMHPHAEVKLRGVVVGEVRQISSTGDGARLALAIQPDKVNRLPANVSAELLPTTLFGERYVDLVVPADPAPQRLTTGSVIGEDRSRDAIELQKVLSDLLPMLTAVQPQKLAVTLTAISTALQGRGTELGATLSQVNSYLSQFNPQLPRLDTDITALSKVANDYNSAAPDLVQALNDFSRTSQTVVAERNNLSTLYATLTGTSEDLTTFLTQNRTNIIRLDANALPTLRTLARYSAEFPCTLQQLVNFEPAVDKVLGKGTDKPGLQVSLHPVPSLGRYVPGRDAPKFDDNSGPHCYPVPFGGVTLRDGTRPTVAQPAVRAGTQVPAADPSTPVGVLGLANSPAENEFINELVAPSVNQPPRSLPDWSSVLVGPVFRGTEVTLK